MGAVGREEKSLAKGAHHWYGELYGDSDRIVKVMIADNLFLPTTHAEEIEDVINDFTNRILHLILVIPGKNKFIDKGFLFHMSSEQKLKFNVVAIEWLKE